MSCQTCWSDEETMSVVRLRHHCSGWYLCKTSIVNVGCPAWGDEGNNLKDQSGHLVNSPASSRAAQEPQATLGNWETGRLGPGQISSSGLREIRQRAQGGRQGH